MALGDCYQFFAIINNYIRGLVISWIIIVPLYAKHLVTVPSSPEVVFDSKHLVTVPDSPAAQVAPF